jgi:hypothetical protein
MQYFDCNLSGALHKLSLFHQQNHLKDAYIKGECALVKTSEEKIPESIRIIDEKQVITDPSLCNYIERRRVAMEVANIHCKEVSYTLNDKTYTAIGFRNTAGGYELRNEYFKGSSSPKYVTYLDNNAKDITVFEGFFDFLTYQSIYLKEAQHMTNFLVLNSLSFFERSLLLMEKHDRVHLYLDHDKAGRKCTQMAQQRSLKYRDESRLYKGHKDLNEWRMNCRFSERKERSLRLRL